MTSSTRKQLKEQDDQGKEDEEKEQEEEEEENEEEKEEEEEEKEEEVPNKSVIKIPYKTEKKKHDKNRKERRM